MEDATVGSDAGRPAVALEGPHKGFTGEGGWEFELLLLVGAITLLLLGGGKFAVDRLLFGT